MTHAPDHRPAHVTPAAASAELPREERGGLVWQRATPEAARALAVWERRLAATAARATLDPAACDAGLRLVKDNRVRRVFRLADPALETPLYCKHYRPQGKRAVLRVAFVGSRVRREAQMLRAFAACGLPVPRLVAWGESTDPARADEGWVIMEEVPAAVDVLPYVTLELPRAGGAAVWRRKAALLERLAALARRLHEAGFLHDDFHLGNLLIVPATGALSVLDLHQVRQVRRVSAAARLGNLALLLHSFKYRFNASDAARLLRAYWDRRPPRAARHAAGRALVRRVAALHRRRLASRVAKAFEDSGAWARAVQDDLIAVHARDLPFAAMLAFLDGSAPAAEVRGWERAVYTGGWQARAGLTRGLAGHPAAAEWRRRVALWLLGRSARRPLALLAERRGRGLGRALIVDAPFDPDAPERRPPPQV